MKTLVLQKKGGSGKSTFSLGIYPFLVENLTYIDLDTLNKETHLIEIKSIKHKFLNPLEEKDKFISIIKFFPKSQNIVFDVGTEVVNPIMNILTESENLLRYIDIVCIPMKKNYTDIEKGIEIYRYLKENNYNGKIVFILNEISNYSKMEEEFIGLFHWKEIVEKQYLNLKEINPSLPPFEEKYLTSKFNSLLNEIDKKDRNFFAVPFTTVFYEIKNLFRLLPKDFYTTYKEKKGFYEKELEKLNTIIEELVLLPKYSSEETKKLIQALEQNIKYSKILELGKKLDKLIPFLQSQRNIILP